MTTDIIELNGFIILVGTADAKEMEVSECTLEEDTIGITFYGSGSAELDVSYARGQQTVKGQQGSAFSFFGNHSVRLSQRVSPTEPLREVSIFSTVKNIQQLPAYEKELYTHHLSNLFDTTADFEVGPRVLMSPEMQTAISKIFSTTFQETTRLLFLQSQVIELLSHYFACLNADPQPDMQQREMQLVQQAGEIIVQNMEQPPSLKELSELIGMNNNKLQKHFKQIFGVPVYKYLQAQRLQKAYALLREKGMPVQEVAWSVGYESLSSFSNAFQKQFGFRPSEVPG